jgi:hypothetical protein
MDKVQKYNPFKTELTDISLHTTSVLMKCVQQDQQNTGVTSCYDMCI